MSRQQILARDGSHRNHDRQRADAHQRISALGHVALAAALLRLHLRPGAVWRGLRVHVSIETDRPRIDGLPPHASSVADRFEAARSLKSAGVFTVITVSPLLPIAEPEAFFARVGEAADAVVIDHFIEGDGTPDGRRTRRTPLVTAIEAIDPRAATLDYRDAMVAVAHRFLPGRVGVNIDGFAGPNGSWLDPIC